MNVATITGTMTAQDATSRVTGGLADDIVVMAAGVDTFPDEEKNNVGSMAEFTIKYTHLTGNPYGQ